MYNLSQEFMSLCLTTRVRIQFLMFHLLLCRYLFYIITWQSHKNFRYDIFSVFGWYLKVFSSYSPAALWIEFFYYFKIYYLWMHAISFRSMIRACMHAHVCVFWWRFFPKTNLSILMSMNYVVADRWKYPIDGMTKALGLHIEDL